MWKWYFAWRDKILAKRHHLISIEISHDEIYLVKAKWRSWASRAASLYSINEGDEFDCDAGEHFIVKKQWPTPLSKMH